MKDGKQFSRREVLTAAGAIGLSSLGVAAGEASAQPQRWDAETDVLCVGSGAAACTAAIVATAEGARTMLVEKLPVLGGTTSKSAGVMWVPNHYILRQNGIDDARSACLEYMARYSYPRLYDKSSPTLGLSPRQYSLLAGFYDHGAKAIDRLRSLGVMEFKEFRLDPANQPAPDYAEHYEEDKVAFRRTIEPAVETSSILAGSPGGTALARFMEKWLKDQSVPVLTETRATALVMEQGRVVGIKAEANGATQHIRARKAVVFGTGGYAHNLELVALHQPALRGSCARVGSTGDFIPIAGAVGAQMGALDTAWRTQVLLEEALQNRAVPLGAFYLPGDSMIVVNKYGRRVVNEKRNYNDRTQIHFVYDPGRAEYPNDLLFMLFDQRALDAYGGAFPLPLDPREQPCLIRAENWDAMSTTLGQRLAAIAGATGGVALDPAFAANLRDSLDRFKGFAKTGVDEDFGRGAHRYDHAYGAYFSPRRPGTQVPENPLPNKLMFPLAEQGPYYALILAAGALDTSGGPAINDRAQVLDSAGQPIRGLYGAGNCIAAPTGRAYYGGGGTLGPAIAYGYIAGMNAAKEPV